MAQATVAVLSAVGAAGTVLLHDLAGFLPAGWAAGISSVLAVLAAVAGFIEHEEPVIDDLDQYAQ
ncbi:hypothetical protein BMG05_18430 [Mycobacterium malmoense]|nr:hypothetical protein BMG05_18430 [Mycobacterium malmoense]